MVPSTTENTVVCAVAGRCGGCPLIGQPLAVQTAARRKRLVDRVPAAAGARVRLVRPESALRDRLEVQVRDGVFGMLGAATEGAVAAFVPIDDCPASSEKIRKWFRELVANPPPLARASLRLRVAPDGLRGMWIDADLKLLRSFEQHGTLEHVWLQKLLAARTAPVVETGQRGHEIIRLSDGELVKRKTVPRPWFQTFVGDRPIPLLSRVADFSQPSLAGNRRLLQQVLALATASGELAWLELGAGGGNMTFALLGAGFRVRAVELDVSRLNENIVHIQSWLAHARDSRAGLMGRAVKLCEPRSGSLGHGRDVASWLLGFPAVLADPPRSGLGAFADALGGLSPSLRPRVIVYVSCWLDALSKDAETLQQQGYRLDEAVGVEQFTDSPEVEWVTVWRQWRAPKAGP